jgi:hypothetical protein
LRVDFDRRLKLVFHGSKIITDGQINKPGLLDGCKAKFLPSVARPTYNWQALGRTDGVRIDVDQVRNYWYKKNYFIYRSINVL